MRLEGTCLESTCLESTCLEGTCLEGTFLESTCLESTCYSAAWSHIALTEATCSIRQCPQMNPTLVVTPVIKHECYRMIILFATENVYFLTLLQPKCRFKEDQQCRRGQR